MKYIGIAGQHSNGKDELADYLYSKMHSEETPWQRDAFARNVKKVFSDAFGVDFEFIEKWKREPNPPPGFLKSIRKSLQFIGDGFREILSEVWIDWVFREKGNKIISDLRYLNEIIRVYNEEGYNILIYRRGWLNDDPNGSEAQIRPYVEWCLEHIKEPIGYPGQIQGDKPDYMDKIHMFVRNDGTLEDLYNLADDVIIPTLKNYFGED